MDRLRSALLYACLASPLSLLLVLGCGGGDERRPIAKSAPQVPKLLTAADGRPLVLSADDASTSPGEMSQRVSYGPVRLPPVESGHAAESDISLVRLPPVEDDPFGDAEPMLEFPASSAEPADEDVSPEADNRYGELDDAWQDQVNDAAQPPIDRFPEIAPPTKPVEQPNPVATPPTEAESSTIDLPPFPEESTPIEPAPSPEVTPAVTPAETPEVTRAETPDETPDETPAEAPKVESTQADPVLAKRSPDPAAMRLVAWRAAGDVQQGFRLAERGAWYSARSEFIHALRRITQAYDAVQQSKHHSRALAAGLLALKEADDFVPGGSQVEADLDLNDIVYGHRTPVLKTADLDDLAPLVARQRYYTFAQEQLTIAGASQRAASMALYGLGRVYTTFGNQTSQQRAVSEPKAMAVYQAALAADAGNYMAANELGVLLARYGLYQSAKSLLISSLRQVPQVAAWHNLAVVHDALGETSLAALAREEATRATKGKSTARSGNLPDVVWADVATFSRSSVPVRGQAAQAPARSRQK